MEKPGDREEELSIRLTLAQAWVDLWRRAFDALLHHGVNVRATPEYGDPDGLLDKAMQGDIRQGQVAILEYLRRVANGLKAAIKRKSFRQV